MSIEVKRRESEVRTENAQSYNTFHFERWCNQIRLLDFNLVNLVKVELFDSNAVEMKL